ncbi:MAG: ABC transporter permease, partial [Clostridia bacterium]|nr:ABC transporter permease [Clostridia bacterium]
ELIFKKNLPFWAKLAGVIVGSIIYRLIIMLALQMPFAETYDMKLITAILLVLAMSVTVIKKRHHKKEAKHA